MNISYRVAYIGGQQSAENCVLIGISPDTEREILFHGRRMTEATAVKNGLIGEDFADGFEDGHNHFDGEYETLERAGVTIRRKVLLAAQMFSVPEEYRSAWDGKNIVTANEIAWKATTTGKNIGELVTPLGQIDNLIGNV